LYVRDFLTKHYGNQFDSLFGRGTGKAMLHATAGSLIGIGEIFLLPLDVLKIKRQTNPEAFRGRGLFKIIRDEGFALYRGWEWTAARNAPGSFAVYYSHTYLIIALWRQRLYERIPLWIEGLQFSDMDAEYSCLDGRRSRIVNCLCANGRH
jgi:hypothetical protein